MIRIKDIVGLPTLEWHLTNKRTLSENVYRYSSESFIQLFTEARQAWRDGKIQLNELDKQLLEETDIGLYGEYEGQKVPLDLPMEEGSYEEGGEDDRKYALLRVEPRNYEDMIDKLQDMDINHNRQSDTVIKVYTDRIPDKVVYNLTHDVWVDKFVLNEASLRIEAYPEDDSLKKLLNKHNIKIKIIDDGGFMGIPEVELTGDRRDLEKLLVAKDGWGWAKDYIEESTINEAEYQGKEVPLNKPKRGGSKKFYVYVKNKKGNVQKVSFGGTTGLNVKIDEPGARSSFAARHKCATKKDKTKPGYWSCNIGRYWKSLGGSKNFSGYW